MTKFEIMNCAAILAAGMMADNTNNLCYTAEQAVDLMEQIAAVIAERQKDEKRSNLEKWVK